MIKSIDPSIKFIPSGYKRVGEKIILRSRILLEKQLGVVIMQAYSWCTGVFQHQTTIGEIRRPQLISLAGDSNTIVNHKENGCVYVIDIDNITFSGGNRGLRKRLVEVVNDRENLLDMFAAVGNLSLQPIVKRNIKAILTEKSEYTYDYLLRTLKKNNVTPIALNADCREVNIKNWADRIFMGYHNVDLSHIQSAVHAAKKQAIFHLHPLAKPGKYEEWSDRYCRWILEFAKKSAVVEINKIKNYSPGLHHIEVVISINR